MRIIFVACCAIVASGIRVRRQPAKICTYDAAVSFNHTGSNALGCFPIEGQIAAPAVGSPNCLLMTQPSPFVKCVTDNLVGLPQDGKCGGTNCNQILPYNAEERRRGEDWPPKGYTMVGTLRLKQFQSAIEDVDRNNIAGSIVETGVWRGGAMVLAAAVTKEAKTARDLYLFDAFENIPSYKHSDYLSVKESFVVDAFPKFDVAGPNVHIEKGLFRDTLPPWKNSNAKIAVLRIDANFYDSYQDCLYHLYEKVPVNGIVIFDDVMSHPNVMRAWNDFKNDQGATEALLRIDKHSAWFRKQKSITIDWGKMKPPQDCYK